MKPFNLESAKEGKKVVTREGRNVRLVSFNNDNPRYPIVGIIEHNDCDEVNVYTIAGMHLALGGEHDHDLFMADDEPKQEVSDLQAWCREILPVVQAAANGEDMQVFNNGKWEDKLNSVLAGGSKYRIKPKIKMVNGFEVPLHETVEPYHAQEYFTPSLAASNMWTSKRWGGYKTDKNLLDRGLVYIDKESAVKCAKAMLGIDQEGEE